MPSPTTAADLGYKIPAILIKRHRKIHAEIMAGDNAKLQALIDNGMAWRLEGSVGRAASSALNAGACVLPAKGFTDYYGNKVPAYWMLEDGTRGTIGNAENYDPEY